jgi:hypothetical protein
MTARGLTFEFADFPGAATMLRRMQGAAAGDAPNGTSATQD